MDGSKDHGNWRSRGGYRGRGNRGYTGERAYGSGHRRGYGPNRGGRFNDFDNDGKKLTFIESSKCHIVLAKRG